VLTGKCSKTSEGVNSHKACCGIEIKIFNRN